MVFARQVHGTAAALVGPEDRGRGTLSEDDAVADTDILVTAAPGVTLAILVADCVPLALVDPEAGVLAAVHAGWRGTAAGAVGHALHAMEDCGGRAGRVRAFLGPAVHPDRYQVSDEVQRALSEAVRPAAPDAAVARPDGPGHWLVDLVAANRQQLLAGGCPRRAHRRVRRHHGGRGLLQSTAPNGPAAASPCWPGSTEAGTGRLRRSMGGPGSPGPPTCMPPSDRFRYDGFAIDPADAVVTCRYSTAGHTFTERFTFGTEGDWADPAVDAAVRILYLLAGVSYYKTSAAPVIDLGDLPTTAWERDFLRSYYVNGLGEFAYRNGLDLRGLRLEGPDAPPAPAVRVRARHPVGP